MGKPRLEAQGRDRDRSGQAAPATIGVAGPTSSPNTRRAEVAELADALHSGCSARQGVEVRVLSSAPEEAIDSRRIATDVGLGAVFVSPARSR